MYVDGFYVSEKVREQFARRGFNIHPVPCENNQGEKVEAHRNGFIPTITKRTEPGHYFIVHDYEAYLYAVDEFLNDDEFYDTLVPGFKRLETIVMENAPVGRQFIGIKYRRTSL
jgi:hypothetical protein